MDAEQCIHLVLVNLGFDLLIHIYTYVYIFMSVCVYIHIKIDMIKRIENRGLGGRLGQWVSSSEEGRGRKGVVVVHRR